MSYKKSLIQNAAYLVGVQYRINVQIVMCPLAHNKDISSAEARG